MVYLMLQLFFLSWTTTLDQSAEKKLFLCSCEMESPIAADTVFKKKEVYYFLVKGHDGRACCENKALKNHTGYLEIWHNEAPRHPGVWARQSLTKIDARVAQETGCNLPEKIVALRDMAKYPDIQGFYPELK